MSTSISTSTTTPAARPTAACNLYETPNRDANCAMPYRGNHTDIMAKCCGDANVVSYYDDCGIYCLALDQTVSDLTECLYDNGAAWADVFCVGTGNATATATSDEVPTSASASVVASGGSSKDDDKDGDKDDKKDGDDSSDDASSSSNDGDDDSAAHALRPQSVSTVGLVIGALLFSATAFGAVL